jgi:hypothetical protein
MLRTRGFSVVAALLAIGCGQGEGDRCEIDDDCSGDLVCALSPGRSDGVCRSQAGVRPVDGSTPDRQPADAPADSSADRSADSQVDSRPPDASADGGLDGSTSAVPDSSAPVDAPVDLVASDRPGG